MSKLKAGWGQADITPRGGPISLCGQFETRITSEILDPMLAVALILEKDGVRSIWVGCDIISAYDVLTDEVEALLLEQVPGFEPAQLAIAGTHIHTGPYIKRERLLSLTGDEGLKKNPGTLTTAGAGGRLQQGFARPCDGPSKHGGKRTGPFGAPHHHRRQPARVYKDGRRACTDIGYRCLLRMEAAMAGRLSFVCAPLI